MAIFSRTCGWNPIGQSMKSRSRGGQPQTSAKYSFSIDAGGELLGQFGVGLIVAGHQDHAAGVAVEPVDDARPAQPAGGAQGRPEMELQGAGQRARPVSPGRMHDHARRLVDHHQVLVLVEDVQRDVFGPRGLAGDFRQHDRRPAGPP